jgi:hypothetical protein
VRETLGDVVRVLHEAVAFVEDDDARHLHGSVRQGHVGGHAVGAGSP